VKNAVIAGTGASLPSRVLTNPDLEKMVDTTDEWITTRTGIKERRIEGPGEPVSKFAIEASTRAIERAGIAVGDLDLIITATVTPDRLIPATSCFIQRALGAPRAAAFDIQAGCSGFLYALQLARMGIMTGEYKNALVIGAELLSYLTFLAKKQGLLGFDATVLQENRPMLHLFESMGFEIEKRLDAGSYELKMSFRE
jgi:3-oxoacyl-[acyl-carrier-protein] synthase-3